MIDVIYRRRRSHHDARRRDHHPRDEGLLIGYGGGGSDFAMKNMPANRDNPFGGGRRRDQITSVAFLVIRGEKRVDAPGSRSRLHVRSTRPDRSCCPTCWKTQASLFCRKKAAKEWKKQPKSGINPRTPAKAYARVMGCARFV